MFRAKLLDYFKSGYGEPLFLLLWILGGEWEVVRGIDLRCGSG